MVLRLGVYPTAFCFPGTGTLRREVKEGTTGAHLQRYRCKQHGLTKDPSPIHTHTHKCVRVCIYICVAECVNGYECVLYIYRHIFMNVCTNINTKHKNGITHYILHIHIQKTHTHIYIYIYCRFTVPVQESR